MCDQPLPDLTRRLALRPREAAAVLGLSERALRALLPRLPHLRAGSAVLIPVDALRRWLMAEAGPAARTPRPLGEDEASIIAREELAKLGL